MKTPIFSKFWAQGPSLGVKTLLGPPDQNPGSAPAFIVRVRQGMNELKLFRVNKVSVPPCMCQSFGWNGSCRQGRIQDFGLGCQQGFEPGRGLSPTCAQNRGFSLKIASKLHNFEKILGPLDPLVVGLLFPNKCHHPRLSAPYILVYNFKPWPHRARSRSRCGNAMVLHMYISIRLATPNAFVLLHCGAATRFARC